MSVAPGPTGRVQSVNPFNSFFMAGFECSTHRLLAGGRLDMIAATRHDEAALSDYRQLRQHGIRTVRDGLRWHLIDKGPGDPDWSSFLPMLRAGREAGMQVIWDLCHYGWPADLDIWSPKFVDRFACFAGAVARVVRAETDTVPLYCPVNEISFWAWAGGNVGYLNPHARGQGPLLKRQLVQAAIAGMEAVRAVDPRARFVHAEPIINIVPRKGHPEDMDPVTKHMRGQWEAFDMLAGHLAPELGGKPDYLDLIGVNFYPDNQWVHEYGTIPLGRHDYRPFRNILASVSERYNRPIIVAETGAEGSAGPAWLHYVAGEVGAAVAEGVPVQGICLYPVLDYPGWDNERICPVGLLRMTAGPGGRAVNEPLAAELRRQSQIVAGDKREEGRRAAVGQSNRRRRS